MPIDIRDDYAAPHKRIALCTDVLGHRATVVDMYLEGDLPDDLPAGVQLIAVPFGTGVGDRIAFQESQRYAPPASAPE